MASDKGDLVDVLAALRAKLALAGSDAPSILEAMKGAIRALGFSEDNPAYRVLGEGDSSGRRLFEVIEELTKAGTPRSEINTFLLPGLPHVSGLSPVTVSQFLDVTLQGGKSSPGPSIGACAGLFARMPDLGEAALEHILQEPNEFRLVKAEVVARAIAASQSERAFSYLMEKLGRRNDDACFAALCGLCELEPAVQTIRDLLTSNASELHELVASALNAETCRRLGWRLLCRLSEVDTDAGANVALAATSGPADAQIEIAMWIWMRPRVAANHPKFPEILAGLAAAAVPDSAVRLAVDEMFAGLLTDSQTRHQAIVAMDLLFNNAAALAPESEFPRIYSCVQGDPQLYSSVLTRIILTKDARLSWIKPMVFLAAVQPSLLRPDLEQFIGATQDARVRAIRRIIGTCHNGEAVCIFVWDIANCTQLHGWSITAFEDVCSNYLRIEYPSATKRFLEARAKELQKGHPLKKLVTHLLKYMRRWDRILANLPKAHELTPTESQRFAFRAAQLQQMREIEKGVRERSIMAQFATQFAIKQGKRTVMHLPGAPPTVTTLSRISHQFEIPSSEVNDPMMGHLLRARYLSERS